MSDGEKTVVIIGGGAAGYFAAITAAETNPSLQVILLEAGSQVLRKVKISGGGRCNLTHHCFDPKELSTKYPRGARELRTLCLRRYYMLFCRLHLLIQIY